MNVIRIPVSINVPASAAMILIIMSLSMMKIIAIIKHLWKSLRIDVGS